MNYWLVAAQLGCVVTIFICCLGLYLNNRAMNKAMEGYSKALQDFAQRNQEILNDIGSSREK